MVLLGYRTKEILDLYQTVSDVDVWNAHYEVLFFLLDPLILVLDMCFLMV